MNKQNSTAARSGRDARSFRLVPALVVFAVCFAVHVGHHFFLYPDKHAFLYDGCHYLETSGLISKILMSAFSGDWSGASAIAIDRKFHENVLFDGPVVPLIPAVISAVFQRVPEPIDWQLIVALNAFCQSLSAVLVFLLAIELTESLLLACTVASLFGLHPAVIVNSGRFLTEPWAVLFLLSFVFLVTRASVAANFAGGLAAGLVVMIKAALVPALAAVVVVRGTGGKQMAKNVAAVCAGIMVAVAPWFLFTARVVKQPTIFTLRQPAYNAAVGVDLGADGWCTIPETSFVTEMKNELDPLAIQLKALTEHGGELASLSVRKLGRLFAHPWNDTRQPTFLAVGAIGQDFVHKLLLCLSIFGIGMWLVQQRRLSKTSAGASAGTLILSSSLCVIAGHLVYVCFQGMGRYSYTALPFMALLAGFGVKTIFAGFSKQKVAIAVASVFIVTLLANCEQFCLPYGGYSAPLTILPGSTFTLRMANWTPEATAAILLVDGSRNIENAAVVVNGVRLDERPAPAGQFSAGWYYRYGVLRDHACFLGKPQSDFRQTRAVVLPVQLLRANASNTVSILNETRQPITIYGDCLNRSFLQSPDQISSDKMLVSMSGDDLRVPLMARDELACSYYWQRAGGETEDCKSLPGISFAVVSEHSLPSEPEGSSKPKEFSTRVAASGFPRQAVFDQTIRASQPTSSSEVIGVNLRSVSKTGSLIHWVQVPELHSGSQLMITLKGKARIVAGDGRVGLRAILVKKDESALVPHRFPDFIAPGKDWREFTLSDCIPRGSLGGPIKAVGVELFPGPVSQSMYGYLSNASDAEIKDLSLQLTAKDSIDLTEFTIRYR